MDQQYIGYVKLTKKDKFRPALGTLHDMGEDDGDRLVNEVATSNVVFEELPDAIAELEHQCQNAGITDICTVPIRRAESLWESQLRVAESAK